MKHVISIAVILVSFACMWQTERENAALRNEVDSLMFHKQVTRDCINDLNKRIDFLKHQLRHGECAECNRFAADFVGFNEEGQAE